MSKVIHEKELLAYLAGEKVEYRRNPFQVISADDWAEFNDDIHSLELFNNMYYELRIVPKTVTIALPQPFTPNVGETYWCLNTLSNDKYSEYTNDFGTFDRKTIAVGAWRTEEEIKQVVLALENMKRSVK